MSDLSKSEEDTTVVVSMRTLLSREMSKEVEERQSCSNNNNNNLVAKLMGLESAAPRSRSTSSSTSVDDNDARKHDGEYEVWESKGKCNGSTSDRKQLDLVRRKFLEAKRLVTNEKLHGSKEFQEALEVLSSNKELFVKFLQESNSLFSQHLSEFQPVTSPHHEAKRITVLRPSKAVDAQKCGVQDSRSKRVKKPQDTGWIDDAKPTRIVVLKPSPGKALDIKAVPSSPQCFDEAGDAETRQVAKEITRQIRETFRGHYRDETLSSPSSSVLSNGYIADEGSLNRSNYEYPVGNICSSEIMSPSSRHSWDFVNRFDSPFASSSLSRASFSPDSSVYREAKKRLSERWALVSLSGDAQQPKTFPKGSTALGDMLALSEKKVPTKSSEESKKVKQDTKRSVSCIGSGLNQVESTSDSLERSKSVPEIRHDGGTSVSGTPKVQAARELTVSRSLKSSWKVSSLFSFRNKKASKEKTGVSMYRNTSQLAMPSDAAQQQSISLGEGELQNQDQPSPVSVLLAPFEEEYMGNPECSESTKPWTTQGEEMSLRSNLIDKSPPIGSIARVSSWEDDLYTDIVKPGTGIKEDEDWYIFIKTLLQASGFSSSDPLITRWYSPDSPLDPSLRDKFASKELIKRRKQRTNRKLVYDCVNAIIIETASTLERTGLTLGSDMVEHVWTEIKNWAVQDSNSLEAETMDRDEVVGKKWSHNLQVEVNNLGIDIELILLQELVEEAVFDLTL